MTLEYQIELMEEIGFKINNKVKILGITMINMNYMLFQNNYVMMWTGIKTKLGWEKLKLSLWGEILW